MILSFQHISKAFGEHCIVHGGSFHLEEHEKAALIGINGAGKSTILKMITGEETPDEGVISITSGKTLGCLAQKQDLTAGSTIYEEVSSARSDVFALEDRMHAIEQELPKLSGDALEDTLAEYNRVQAAYEEKNGYACRSEITGVLKGLGFTLQDFDKSTATLSGGQKTRVSLGKLLLTSPDILLLDEPTNHLDMRSVSWLETFLINYPGAVLVVSHDRYFLNRVATKVIEIENGEILSFSGNYTAFAEKKQVLRTTRIREYVNQQREIRHQQEVIEKLRSFNREKSVRRADSREKTLEKMQRLDDPVQAEKNMNLKLEPAVTSGNDVLRVENLAKSFDGQSLFSDVNFEIHRGEHIAVIGDNGTGKTTLLKILNEVIPADEGSFTLGAKVHIGYYDQEHHVLHEDKTIFEEISDAYPGLNNTQIRSTLAAFQFTGEDVFKEIRTLSGGERGRVSLARLMLSQANFLILDEPTNHLDINSREILEDALNSYTGTLLCVSHDRYFINHTATRILELTNRQFVNYIGNYDYYLEKKEELTAAYTQAAGQSTRGRNGNASQNAGQAAAAGASSVGAAAAGAASLSADGLAHFRNFSDFPDNAEGFAAPQKSSKQDWQKKKELQAQERKRRNDLKKVENEIARLEERNEEIDLELTREEVYSDPEKCQALAEEKSTAEEQLEELYARWEELEEQEIV